MLARQAGEGGDDEDWEDDDAEETALEGYTTSVDDEDNLVDEYQIFKAILQSEWSGTLPFGLFQNRARAHRGTANPPSSPCRYPDPRAGVVPGANAGPGRGAGQTPAGHRHTCRPETGSTR